MITTIKEYKLTLNETVDSIIKIKGYLHFNKEFINQEELYSKLRAIKGLTILTPVDIISDEYQTKENYYIGLNIKIDYSVFEKFNLKWLKKEILTIYGVKDVRLKIGEFPIKKNG